MYESSEQSDLLQATLAVEPPCLMLTLRGELDLGSVRELPRDAYSSRSDLSMVLIDLGELTFCDLAGIRALLAFRRSQQALGRSVAVVRATPVVWRLMGLCGVTDRLEVARTAAVTLV